MLPFPGQTALCTLSLTCSLMFKAPPTRASVFIDQRTTKLNTHGAGGRYLIYTIVEVTVNTSSLKQGCTNADIDKKENRELKADGDVK